jgi:hypothetical protein
VISVLLAVALASDPVALRQVHDTSAVVDVGTDALAVAADMGPIRLSAQYAHHANVAVHAGLGRALVGEDRLWGIDGVGALGLALLTATPGVAIVATGEIRGGVRNGNGQATVGLVIPLALRVDAPPELAIPIGLELRLAARLGPLWLGCRGQAGGTLVVSGAPAVRTAVGGFVEYRFRDR